MNAWIELASLRGLRDKNDIDKLIVDDPFRSMRGLYYCAAIVGNDRDDLPPDFSEYMVGDWLEYLEEKGRKRDLDALRDAYESCFVKKKRRNNPAATKRRRWIPGWIGKKSRKSESDICGSTLASYGG
nr:hypothetical protein 3 [bacterium]